MADIPRNPIPITIWNDPGVFSGGVIDRSMIFSGLCSYIEAGERTLQSVAPPSGPVSKFGRHLVCVEDNNPTADPIANSDVGRWMELYTIGDSALPFGFSAGRRLAGKVNSDFPSFATYKGNVGMVDGEGRTQASGDGRLLTQFSHANTGTGGSGIGATTLGADNWTALIHETGGGGTFTTQFPGPSVANGVSTLPGTTAGNAAYWGYTTPFGRLRLYHWTTSTWAGVGVWEYWNGASWAALANVTDGTSGFTGPGPAPIISLTTWEIPQDWATNTVGAVTTALYYIRFRVTTGNASTTGTMARLNFVSRILRESPAIFDPTAALNKVGDTAYWGDPQTFGRVRLGFTPAGAGAVTVAWEYWDGAAWTALAGLTDGTTAFTSSTTPQDVTFTIPGDWAARTLPGGIGPSQFWMRARLTAVATPFTALISSPFATGPLNTTGIVTGRAPVCMDIGAKPGVTGERAPAVIGWGIALPEGVVADPTGLFTYWDPVRQIHSRRFDPTAIQGSYIPTHGEPAVTEIAQWSDTTRTATLVGTGGTGAGLVIDTTTADPNVSIGVDSGAPVFYDETKIDRDLSQQGYTTCVLRNRVYIARGNRVIWTERGDFHQVAPANGIDIAPNDGDEVTAIFTFAEKVIVYKRHHIYALVGEPSIGTTGIQVIELSNEIGCTAKRSIVDVGSQLLFLSQSGVRQMDANGLPQPLESSQPVDKVFQRAINDHGDLMHQAVAAWEPSKQLYILAMPGLQEQLENGAGPGINRHNNDGCMVYCRSNGQWAIWAGHPMGFASLTTYWTSSNSRGVVGGNYWGRIFTLNAQPYPAATGDNLGDIGGVVPRTGAVTSVAGVGIINDTGAFLDETSDTRLIGAHVLILSGKQAGKGGMVTDSTVNAITVFGNINAALEVGDRYAIGNIYWYADTGDLLWDAPNQERSLRTVRPIFNGNPLGQPTDIGVDSTSVRDQTQRQGVSGADAQSFKMAGGTVTTPAQGGTPRALAVPSRRGQTARVRVAGRLGAGTTHQDKDGKPRIRQLILGGRTFGRAGDT